MRKTLHNLSIATFALLLSTPGLSQNGGDLPTVSGKYSSGLTNAYTPCPTLSVATNISNLYHCDGVTTTTAAASMTAGNGAPNYFYTYFNNNNQSVNQTSCALPGHGSTYTAPQTRGLWFICPTNTVLTGVRVPTDVGTANQFVYIIKLAAIPPEYTGTTTNYTVLGKYLDIPGTGIIDCGIPLNAGDIIGVLGVRGNTAIANASSSYATPSGTFVTSIGGFTTTLLRFIFQSNIATTNLGAVSSASTGAIGRVEMYFGSSISNTSSASGLNTGNYSCYYTDANGCMNTTTFAISPPATITAVTSVTNAVCGLDGLASVNPGAGYNPYTYSWSPAGGTGSVTTSNMTAGTYSCFISDVSGNCLTTTVNIADNVSVSTLSIDAGSGSICAGETITLTASGSSTVFSWNGIPGNVHIDSPSANSSYTVETGVGTCATTSVVSITVNPEPTVSVASSTTVSCAGESVTLTASGAQSYSWSTSQNSPVAVVTPSGNTVYTVTGTDASGCSASAVIIQSVNPTPTISTSSNPQSLCEGESLTITANGASTYSWSVGSQTTATITVTASAGTSYSVTGTGSNGCSSTEVASVTVYPLPNLVINSSLAVSCASQPVSISVSGANTYTWNTSESTATISVSPSVTTIYTVSGTSTEGCESKQTFTQTVMICENLSENGTQKTVVLIYPNPVNKELNIETTNATQVEIFNALGSSLYKGKLMKGANRIDFSAYSDGIYYINVNDGLQTNFVKVIKH